MPPAILEVERLIKHFGGVSALEAVSFALPAGSTMGLIGPNGAGKTTLFNCLTGVLSPDRGAMRFGRPHLRPLAGAAPHEIVRRGIARTFQNIRLFANMSVLDNVMAGAFVRTRAGVIGAVLLNGQAREEERLIRLRALELLEFVGLTKQVAELAGALPFGWQRRLEIARALASDPSLLLLDEPAAGLNPIEKQELMRLIGRLKAQGLSMLLIEHDMQVVMPVSDHVVVLDYGEIIAQGPPGQVQRNPRVIEAYLGVPAAM